MSLEFINSLYPNYLIIVSLSLDLTIGQSVTYTELTQNEITATYASAASPDFVPYIVDPATTTDLVDRVLHRR